MNSFLSLRVCWTNMQEVEIKLGFQTRKKSTNGLRDRNIRSFTEVEKLWVKVPFPRLFWVGSTLLLLFLTGGRKCRIEWVMGVHSSKQATVVLSEVLVCVKTILEYSLLLLCKEERSGGTVDWPPKLQTTNLVGLFRLPGLFQFITELKCHMTC